MESTDKREWSQYYHFEKDTSGNRWQRSTTTNSWSSKWIRRCHVNSAVWRQRPPRRQQYRNEPGLSHQRRRYEPKTFDLRGELYRIFGGTESIGQKELDSGLYSRV